jgi:ComF family protein
MILKILSSVKSFVLPARCLACSELVEEDNSLCSNCFSKLTFISFPYCKICGSPFEFIVDEEYECGKCIANPPKYELARSLFKFDISSKKLIHRFKYNDQTSSAKLFARLLFLRYKNDLQDIDLIVPVPMNRIKRIFRQYNPPQILGKQLSRLCGVKQIPDLLIKSKWTKAQTTLSQKRRKDNLKGSLYFNEKYNIKGKVILLVDDVRTTGVTSNSCSSILKNYGAKKVKLITIGAT